MSRKTALAADAWAALRTVMTALHADVRGVREELGLTPGESRALDGLHPAEAQPMGALAATLCCDASNVTWLVDRLEALGYVERQVSAADRRVKAVALTPAGEAARARLRASHEHPPAALLALSADELDTLTRLLTKTAANADRPHTNGNSGSRPGVRSHT